MKRTRLIVLILLLLAGVLYATTLYTLVPPGVKPVHRYWNNRLGTHFFTLDPVEKAKLDNEYAHVWVYEGVAFYAWDTDPNALTAEPTP